MKRANLLSLVAVGWVASSILAAPLFGQEVLRLTPEIDQLVARDAKIEKITTNPGFKWTEGPVWIRQGFLLFAEIPGNAIWKWTPPVGSTPTLFIRPSGYTGTAPYGGPEPGSNGMTVGPRGRLTVAGHARRNVWRLEAMDPTAQITVLADQYQGKKLNSPNDLVYGNDGALYFTDPPYGLPTQSDRDPEKQLPFSGVYRIPHAAQQKAGAPPDRAALELLVRDLPRPNGIAFSPDGRVLYVDNSEPKKIWMRYPVRPDGTLDAGTLLCDATSETAPGAPDGMKVDHKGNIYSAAPGGVWIISPSGKHLGTIRMPERTSNVAWGGDDGRWLYITASTSVYRIRTVTGGPVP